MSWRHAAPDPATIKKNAKFAKFAKVAENNLFVFFANLANSAFRLLFLWVSVRNGRDLARTERLEKSSRPFEIELRIARFDAQEEPVSAGEREACHVEYRMVRLRQAVQCQHAEHR